MLCLHVWAGERLYQLTLKLHDVDHRVAFVFYLDQKPTSTGQMCEPVTRFNDLPVNAHGLGSECVAALPRFFVSR